MQRIKTLTIQLYRHHFIRYLFVGGSTFVLDFAILFGLHGKIGLGLGIATSFAYWISIIYNFVLNRYWTFDAREKESLQRHIVAYGMLLICNYAFVLIFMNIASKHINYIYAKAIAVAFQMVWTYPVYKKVIFVPADKSLAS
ncbi:MAG TPA: GtrA family protein [Candidatus Saccharimonadales bacterium]|nr:GtrA family protein [Candidatus Saccharimonadales bacterium]